jgi:hypothetical protein
MIGQCHVITTLYGKESRFFSSCGRAAAGGHEGLVAAFSESGQ